MKVWFFIAVGVYIFLAIIGARDAAYMDLETKRAFFSNRISLLIVLAVVTGAGFFFGFVKLFPKGWSHQKFFVKILLPVIFLGSAFGINRGIAFFANSYTGNQQDILITGKVAGKYSEKKRRGYDYFLLVVDTNGRPFTFEVSEEAFNETPEGHFNKQFTIGSLGIIYRRKI